MITELLLTSALLGAGGQQGLADLSTRLQGYLEVRRVAAQTVPPLTVTNDRAATIAATDALASAIARARAGARSGDIFTPEIAAAMRAAVASGCGQRFDVLRAEIDDETPVPLPPPVVNGRWPEGAALPTMPPDVLEALPLLPSGLEYRFMGSALVLRDVDANVIVDFIRDVVPPAGEIVPARLVAGAVPPLPVTMLSGGQVFLELTLDFDGRVAGVTTLRATPPLTALVADAVRSWRFEPSKKTVENVAEWLRFSVQLPRLSKVLVGAVFLPPALRAPTMGSSASEVTVPDDETPFPLAVTPPLFPLRAFGSGVVLVEVQVATDGSVADACIIESAPPFDGPALQAARMLRFRPAKVEGRAVPSYAYLLYGFPLPITHETAR